LAPSVVAERLGVAGRTLRGWKAMPAFAALVGELRSSAMEEAVSVLAAISRHAAVVLGELMAAAKNEFVRLGAAKAVLESAVKVADAVEISARLDAVEKRFADKGGAQWRQNTA
jgi:hypothetical protein